jgi:hypothetical protein
MERIILNLNNVILKKGGTKGQRVFVAPFFNKIRYDGERN